MAKECEASFEYQLNCLANEIYEKAPQVILLSGPSGSGKTTFASKVAKAITKLGRPASTLSLDDFFIDVKDRKQDSDINLESVELLDTDMLYYCVHQLLSGEPTHIPSFNFATQKRVFEGKQRIIKENELIIVEGIHALETKVKEVFDDIKYLTVYIGVEKELEFPEHVFSGREIRLMRRLVRDELKRGAAPETTLKLWGDVVEYEKSSIIPCKNGADYVIDSFMEYEPYVMRKHLLKVLDKISEDGEFEELKERFTSFAKKLTPVSSDIIPKDSLLCEFIG
jgi:uridine kinase